MSIFSSNFRLYGKSGTSASLCNFGSTTSIASALGRVLGLAWSLRNIEKTLSLVCSLAGTYGFSGLIFVFGLIFSFSRGVSTVFTTTAVPFFSSFLFPKAVIGSGTRLGLGTNGTFSHGISRLWKKPRCVSRSSFPVPARYRK